MRLTFNGNDSREPGFTVMNPAISDISDYTSLYFSIYNDTDEPRLCSTSIGRETAIC